MADVLKNPTSLSGIGNSEVETQELIRGGAALKTAATLFFTASLPVDGAGERGGVLEVTSEGCKIPLVGAMRRGQEDAW